MSSPSNPGANVYTQSFGSAPLSALGIVPIVAPISPSASNIQGPSGPYKLGQTWVNFETQTTYILAGLSSIGGAVTAIWNETSAGTGSLDSLTGNTGGPVFPIAQNIDVLGTGTVATTGSGGTITITASQSGFPITPYVVGPVGRAGYQTIQSALNAANTNPGSVVYIQPGTYTENLTWPLGVSIVSVEPTSFLSEVTIIGSHTVVVGNSSFRQIGAEKVNFQGSGTSIFSGSLTGEVSMELINCIVRANGSASYVFDFPNISSSSNCVFELTDVTVISGGTLNTPSGVNLNVTTSQLGSNPSAAITNAGGVWSFVSSSIQETITLTGGAVIGNGSIFNEGVIASGMLSPALSFTRCSFVTDPNPGITVNGNSFCSLIHCSFVTNATNAIDGTGSRSISIDSISFAESSGINPALTIAWGTASGGGVLIATNDVAVLYGTAFTSSLSASSGTPQALINATGDTANDSWIKIYHNGTPYFIPAWTTAIP